MGSVLGIFGNFWENKKRRIMKEYNISAQEVWEKTLKVNASVEMIKDLLSDITEELKDLKKISYELKEIEKHNVS